MNKFIDALTEFLGGSEDQTDDEVKKELRSMGIDVDAFLARVTPPTARTTPKTLAEVRAAKEGK